MTELVKYEYEKLKYINLSRTNYTNINDFVALDIETTGLSAKYNEIINIGAIRFRNNVPVDKFDMFIKPDRPIPAFITGITGITNSMVRNAPSIDEVLPLLIDFIGNDIILGHNVKFDINFINHAMEVNGFDKYITRYVDTVLIARRFRKNNSLETLVKDYVNPNYVEKHQGLDDALNTARVFYVFKKIAARDKMFSTNVCD